MNFFLQNGQKQTVPHESTARKLSIEWSHTMVLSTDPKVTTTFIDSRFDPGSERVNTLKGTRITPHSGTHSGQT